VAEVCAILGDADARRRRSRAITPHIGIMPHLDLTDEEPAALTQELHDIVESDRCRFSPRIRRLRAILAKNRPETRAAAEGVYAATSHRGQEAALRPLTWKTYPSLPFSPRLGVVRIVSRRLRHCRCIGIKALERAGSSYNR
jgi:hypothetical protein